MGRQNFHSDAGFVELFSRLLDGEVLNVAKITDQLGIQQAAARRKFLALKKIKQLQVVDGGRGIRLPQGKQRPVSPMEISAACLVSSFGSALRETNFRDPLRRIVNGLVSASPKYHSSAHLDRKFWFAAHGGDKALPNHQHELVEVIEALLCDQRIEFSYQHFNGSCERAAGQPLTLVVHQHQLYVLIRKDESSRVHAFRFARMSNVQVADGFCYPTQAEYDPAIIFSRVFGIHVAGDEPIEKVQVRLTRTWLPYAQSHNWHETQAITRNSDGTVDVILHVRISHELRAWILGFGADAEVIAPAKLRDEVKAQLAEAYAQYTKQKSLAKSRTKQPSESKRRVTARASA